MEKPVENYEDSAPKRSRSNEEIKTDKEISSSGGDSGQHSPHDEQQQQQQPEEHSMSACSSNNNNNNVNNNNNHFNNNSDSGLSLKMEDSSGGYNDLIKKEEGSLKLVTNRVDDDDDNTMADIDLDAQKNTISDANEMNSEDITTGSGNLVTEAANANALVADSDKPSTSTSSHIKRRKRNPSRNYRVSGRSSSSSSASSKDERAESQSAEQPPQEQLENQESANPPADSPLSANNNAAEESSPLSPYMFLPYMYESEGHSLSYASSTNSDDDDTDFEPSSLGDLRPEEASNDSEESNRLKEKDEEVNKVLNKQKPPYTWSAGYELLRREHGLSGDGRRSLRNGFTYGFKNRFYGSRHVVERMKISHVLRKHSGCVNCLNFNTSGNLLVTGSDDTRLVVWDWAANKTKHVWKSGHSANIFQAKFLPSSSCIDIISAGRDGKVRRSVVPPSGGKVQLSNLYLHSGGVHKLVISPDNSSEVISVGEDGFICSKDLRESKQKKDILKVYSTTKKTRKVRLYSISHHPFAPEICVSGSDQYVRVYDKRSMKDPVHLMSPEHVFETCCTCCVYNNTGTEILATYSEDNIYLFDNKNYVPGQYLHTYKGHFNQKTIKGVNFFGPNCEYIISGSDCSNIFFWDKNTEAILNFMPGDTAGVVNCLEPHPSTPILATSGLDHNIKIWTPSAEKYPPDLSKLTSCVRRNIRRTGIDDGMGLDGQQLQSLIRQILCHSRGNRRRNRNANANANASASANGDGSDAESGNVDSSSDSSELDIYSDNDDDDDTDDDEWDVSNLRHVTCGTQ